MKTGDRIAGLILIIIGAIVWIYSSNFLSTSPTSDFDASFFPKMIGLSFILTGVLLFLMTYKAKGKKDREIFFHKKEVAMVMIYTLYIIILPFLGFLILTPILLTIIPIYLGSKRLIYHIISSILITFGIYFSFKYLLNVPLPNGIFS